MHASLLRRQKASIQNQADSGIPLRFNRRGKCSREIQREDILPISGRDSWAIISDKESKAVAIKSYFPASAIPLEPINRIVNEIDKRGKHR